MKKIICIVIICIVCVLMFRIKSYETQSKYESKLPVRKEAIENNSIRVLIKTTGYKHTTHAEVILEGRSGLYLWSHGKKEKIENSFSIKPGDKRFVDEGIVIKPVKEEEKITILSIDRNYGCPSYAGAIELYSTAEGIVIVNELDVEEYLCAVVPSEMPASYEMEALKCQAVCARSYAHCQMKKYAYPEYKAHVDDSTSYQVYGNVEEQESSTNAINETRGETVQVNGKTVITYYYSTSCGYTTDVEAWGSTIKDNTAYLKSVEVNNKVNKPYEENLPWYRWEMMAQENELEYLVELNAKKEIGELKSIEVTKRGAGGVAHQLSIKGSQGSIIIETENKIRRVLGGGGFTIYKNDGSSSICGELLPSAFFEITKQGNEYCIKGGGFGHGIGMSQNGANEMAKAGMNYKEILEFFYNKAQVG